MRRLSELEGVCLGILARRNPCTVYQVRRDLKESPSAHWQASAGSVYPLFTKLENEGFVTASADSTDGRGRRLLRVTAKGKKAMRKWVLAGVDAELVSFVTDPIRSRMFSLQVLSTADQLDYLDKVISAMESSLAQSRTHLQRHPISENIFEFFGSLGATMSTEARLDWLRLVRKKLGNTIVSNQHAEAV